MSVCAALGLSAREIREEFSDFFAPVQSSFDKILPKEVLHFVYLRIIKKLFSRFERIFAKQRFGLISSKVFLPVYNHSDRKNSHFGFGSELNLDDVLISDVVKAICSDLRLAKPYKIIELNRSFSDAGIFAYDPSQYFVRNYIGNTEKKLNILSIGSGIIENLSKSLDVGYPFDEVYDSFLYEQFRSTEAFFKWCDREAHVNYVRISEFPDECKVSSAEQLVELADKRFEGLDKSIFSSFLNESDSV